MTTRAGHAKICWACGSFRPTKSISFLRPLTRLNRSGTREIKKVPALRGKTLVNFFVEPSTRTRTSFELAAFRLSADVINISATSLQSDQRRNTQRTRRGIWKRCTPIFSCCATVRRARRSFWPIGSRASVINAGDGAHEHPTQALARSLYDSREAEEKSPDCTSRSSATFYSVASRARISLACSKLGARVTLVGPSTLVPREFEKLGVDSLAQDRRRAAEADVVNLLRIQHERQRKEYFPGIGEYSRLFGLTKERAQTFETGLPDHASRPDQPRRRDRQRSRRRLQSVILDQVTNGLAVRMAVLYLCGGIAT